MVNLALYDIQQPHSRAKPCIFSAKAGSLHSIALCCLALQRVQF